MEHSAVKYVKATLHNSCVPACLAMVLGKTLKEVVKDISEYWEDGGSETGMEDDIMDQYLAYNGYAVQRIHYEYEPSKLLIEGWPIDPFAPIHIVKVLSIEPTGTHAVVWNKNGKVIDPANRNIKMLSHYQRVYTITGIWKVQDSKLFNIVTE